MRLITLFGGMVQCGLMLLCMFMFEGLTPVELYRIASAANGIESLASAFILCCIPGILVSALLTHIGLAIHRSFPLLDNLVNHDYLETGVLKRISQQFSSITEGPEELAYEFKRLIKYDWKRPEKAYDRIMAIIQGIIAIAFIGFAAIGSFLIYSHHT